MLKITNLVKTFNENTENEIQVFDGLDLEFEKNKCTAIIGSNGCGKSTLMNIIGGSILLDSGSILVGDTDISKLKEEERSKYIGRVYQDPSMGVSPSLTILENMALADKKNKKFSLRPLVNKNKINYYQELVKELDLGLENLMDTKVKFLSGGQRQSLSLVMASMKYPDILLLDEHTAALDPKTSHVVMNKTKELIDKFEMTTIMISHNMKDAIEYSDRVIMLDKGRVVLDRDSKDLREEDLNNIYINKLNKAIAI